MSGISKIYHQEKEILYIDYTGCTGSTELIQLLLEAQKLIIAENKEYLQLTNVTSVAFVPEFLKKAKEVAHETPKLARKRAIIGIDSPGRKVLLEFYNAILGFNKVRPFNSIKEAKDWLVI